MNTGLDVVVVVVVPLSRVLFTVRFATVGFLIAVVVGVTGILLIAGLISGFTVVVLSNIGFDCVVCSVILTDALVVGLVCFTRTPYFKSCLSFVGGVGPERASFVFYYILKSYTLLVFILLSCLEKTDWNMIFLRLMREKNVFFFLSINVILAAFMYSRLHVY